MLYLADRTSRYDLTFQFDTIPLKHERDGNQKDLLLYLPDKILVVDQVRLPLHRSVGVPRAVWHSYSGV